MFRKLLIVIATGMCLVGPWSVDAHAADTVVVVQSPAAGFSTPYGGTLTRPGSSGPVGFLALYGGLSVLGFTLTAISLQRRSRMQVSSGPGLAYGRRARADFWAPGPARIPATTASARPALRTGPLPLPPPRDRTARARAGVGSSSPESAAG